MKEVKKVICEFCGLEISKSNYSKHLRRHKNHPESFNFKTGYHLDHDDLFCKFCGKECTNKNSLIQHEIRCKENPDRIILRDMSGKNNPHYGKSAWNKGLTAATDERVNKLVQKCKLFWLLNESKKLKGQLNPAKRTSVRQKISDICLKKSKNGEWHTSLAKNMHYNYKNNDLHGTWELLYAIYLDNNNIKWIRNKERFPYLYNEKTHYYTPDFYLPDSDEYIEIKGYSIPNGKDYAKWRNFPKDKKLIILKEKELKDLGVFSIDISNFK